MQDDIDALKDQVKAVQKECDELRDQLAEKDNDETVIVDDDNGENGDGGENGGEAENGDGDDAGAENGDGDESGEAANEPSAGESKAERQKRLLARS